MKIRYDAVRLSLEKHLYDVVISQILDLIYQTVSTYIKSYKEPGVAGLSIKEKTGRTKTNGGTRKQLYDCISTKSPKNVGYKPFINWTTSLACKWGINLKAICQNFVTVEYSLQP